MKKNVLTSGAARLVYAVTILWFFNALACRPAARDSALREVGDASSDVADLRWLDKASRALRLGKALSPDDPLRQYVNQPKSDVVDILLKDPLFFPTMIDFYGYYFGFKADDSISKKSSPQALSYDPKTKTVAIVGSLCDRDPLCVRYDTYQLSRHLFQHPAALNGALIVTDDKSVDQLYRPSQPPYVAYSSLEDLMSSLIINSQSGSSDVKPIKLETIRETLEQILDSMAQVLKHEIGQAKADSLPGLCEKVNDAIEARDNLLYSLESVTESGLLCPANTTLSVAQAKSMLASANKMRVTLKDLFPFFEAFLTQKLTLHRGIYFEVPESLRKVWKPRLYGQTFWENHPNSSTNFNRKRAAYVLKTFLCDDLTPVKLEIAEHPGDDRHATDPSCMACHYKLDPLAGFFRNYGVIGMNFEGAGYFFFDDGKRLSGAALNKYLSSWNVPDNQDLNRGLNVGLIRSSTDPSKNAYGSTLDDLGRLVAQDPRTFMCKTQRLADYFVGGGLTYDRKWLEGLANKIKSAPKTTNGTAVKSVIKSLLLSKVFSTEDPAPGVCYDRAGVKEGSANLDCVVSSTLEQYCHKCHGSGGARGGLDLSTWSARTGFAHENDDGKPYAMGLSYQKILDRLGPSESGPMMPLNSPMPDPDRRILINWFEKQLQSIK